MSVDVSTLPDNPQVLKQTIIEFSADYDRQIKDLEKQIALALEEVEYWRQKMFGKKSEKSGKNDRLMAQLFNEAELAALEMELAKEETTEKTILVPIRRRQKQGGRKPLPANLPRKDTIITLSEAERICPNDGVLMLKIGEEISEKLHVEPMRVWVERLIRYKFACQLCEGVGTENEGSAVRIAPMPAQLLPKSIATPSLVAYIAASKFCDSLPFYRLSRMMKRVGISISRQTMARWMVELVQLLRPMLALLKKYLVAGSLIGIDETRLQVLNEPGRAATTTSYMWVFRGVINGKPIVLFEYRETHSGDFLPDYLCGFKGYIQTDDFSSYNILTTMEGIILVGCWAHTRRKFFDAAKQSKITGNAQECLEKIKKLYAIEAEARKGNFNTDEIKAIRQAEAAPVLADIRSWLNEKIVQVPPAGLLGKAIEYATRNWEKLERYIEDGIIPIDNNGVENQIRPYVVGRNYAESGIMHSKNGLFYDINRQLLIA